MSPGFCTIDDVVLNPRLHDNNIFTIRTYSYIPFLCICAFCIIIKNELVVTENSILLSIPLNYDMCAGQFNRCHSVDVLWLKWPSDCYRMPSLT